LLAAACLLGSLLVIAVVGGLAGGRAPARAQTSAQGSPASRGAAAVAAGAETPAAAKITGFWGGTDSTTMTITGSAPYRLPAIGGSYGGYIGMIGNWSAWQHCGTKVVWSATNAADARTNLVSYHEGIGVGDYWFMAGPGVDPHYNGTTTEGTAWGAAQARQVISELAAQNPKPSYPVIFMDVELPGKAPTFTPASDNGWNSVYTSACSGKVKSSYVPATVDRADFNGFANYLTSHSSYKAGVYSDPPVWASIFGTGATSAIPNTYQWTYHSVTSSLSHHPSGWCLAGTSSCAQFFGGVTSSSPYALMWQWSGGGGTWNGYGDFDQIDASRTP
jgi:hypothetical protein